MNLSGKNIVITGGSLGIGKETAHQLLDRGANVIVIGRSMDRLKASFKNTPANLLSFDIGDIDNLAVNAQKVLSIFENKIDVLINNAGIGFTGPIEESNLTDVENLFKTNFFGPLEITKQVLPLMRKNGGGLIINITSIAAYIGLPFRGIYCASKSALEIVTESLRMEVKDFNIKIVNIAPGDFKTDIVKRRIDSFNDKKSLYFNKYYRLWKKMNDHVEKGGSDPKMIAILVHKIINKKKPKIHYVIGTRFQKFSIILKRLLPDLLFEKILIKYNKL